MWVSKIEFEKFINSIDDTQFSALDITILDNILAKNNKVLFICQKNLE